MSSELFAKWTQTKVVAADGARGDQFGWSVAVSGDVAVVGSQEVAANSQPLGEGRHGQLVDSALEQDEVVQQGMPGEMYRLYHEYKSDEWERFMSTVTDWDNDTYMECLP